MTPGRGLRRLLAGLLLGLGLAHHALGANTTWDPANKGTHATLSNGNLTVTGDLTNNWGLVLSTTSKSSGKFMIEFTIANWASVGNDFPMMIGAGTSSANLNNFGGATSASFGYSLNAGRTYINGSVTSTKAISGWANSDVADIAIDFDNQTFWVRRNGGNWFADASANPSTNTNGVSFSTVSAGAKFAIIAFNTGGIGTASTATTDFSTTPSFSVPSGFQMWDPVASSGGHLSTLGIGK